MSVSTPAVFHSLDEEYFWGTVNASSPAHVAALNSLLLDHPDINVNFRVKGFTPLLVACERGNLPVVRHLLRQATVDVNVPKEDDGSTPLFFACQNGYRTLAVTLMADPRVDVNRQRYDGATPFFFACQKGHLQVVTALLHDPRIDINRAVLQGITPLIMACFKGHQEVVAALVADPRIDVNVSSSDGGGFTALFVSASTGSLPIVQLILACPKELDTKRRVADKNPSWDNKTAAEIGRDYTYRTRFEGESEAEFQIRKIAGPTIGRLIDFYEEDPETRKPVMRMFPNIRGSLFFT